ncbi:MAG: hypothetical protein KAS23_01505, partial [Anaerohalosphaera sp.]|nr:hypothetical protein [Anaerohalosphaera sp.]
MISFTRDRHIGITAILIMLLMQSAAVYSDSAPPLPAGLSGSSADDEMPALPAGLENEPKDADDPDAPPPLPMGLATDPSTAKTDAQSGDGEKPWLDMSGFWEVRSGYRLRNDKYEKDAALGESRLQLEMEKDWNVFNFKVTTDLYYDWVSENHSVDLEDGQGFLDLREASVSYS